jgi:hypothetical protein
MIEIPMNVSYKISHYFFSHKCHRKSRCIKPLKRRFLKIYGKEAEGFFNRICMQPDIYK